MSATIRRKARNIIYMDNKPKFSAERLNRLMKERDLKPGQVEYLAKISRSQVFYLQGGDKPNVSAVIVAKVAQVLSCSVDYLMCLTDDPTPRRGKVPEEYRELWGIYQQLLPLSREILFQLAEMLKLSQTLEADVQNRRLMRLVRAAWEEQDGPALFNQYAERRVGENADGTDDHGRQILNTGAADDAVSSQEETTD